MDDSEKLLQEKIENSAREFSELFKLLTDLESLIIRGHILIEKSLNDAIINTIKHPEEFPVDKFTFSQKLTFSKMIGVSNPIAKEIGLINKLRNQIAHKLKFDEQLIDQLFSEIRKKQPNIVDKSKSRETSVASSISFICGVLTMAHLIAKK